MLARTLRCESCGWQTACGSDDLATRLRALGLLRRAAQPPDELVGELLSANLAWLTCDQCGTAGLVLADDDGDDGDEGDWQQAIVCEVCRRPIPSERLQIFPDARRCVECQSVVDRGAEAIEPDFCPKCGALVELRVSRGGGITRYKRFCTGDPPCRL